MTKPILIVDDDRLSCEILAKCLSCFGYSTDIAHDGESALQLAKQNRYQFTISDYQMPGMNGIHLFRRLRNSLPTLPGILLTSAASNDVKVQALQAGMRGVISKPPDMHELVALIEEELGARETAASA